MTPKDKLVALAKKIAAGYSSSGDWDDAYIGLQAEAQSALDAVEQESRTSEAARSGFRGGTDVLRGTGEKSES